jgi:hypothetical protein
MLIHDIIIFINKEVVMQKLPSFHQNLLFIRRVFSSMRRNISLFDPVISFILLFIFSIDAQISKEGNYYSETCAMRKSLDQAETYVGQLFLPNSGNRPYAIHFDNQGFMYIVTGDAAGNGKLSRVTPDGTVTDITPLSGSFIGPGLDMDKEGNFFIPLGDHVVKVTPGGEVTTLFSSSSMGIKRALDLVLDSLNNIYIADDIQDKVFKIDTFSTPTVYIDNQLGKDENFSLSDLFFDPGFKNMYLAEGARKRILRYPINEDGQAGTVEILYENPKIGTIFNLALSKDTTIVTVPVEGGKLVMITNEGITSHSLKGANHVIAARYGGVGFDSHSVYLTSAAGVIKVDLLHPPGIIEYQGAVPAAYWLAQNYPNPFNPRTTISYSLPEKHKIVIRVLDIQGRWVATLFNGMQERGFHQIDWDAASMASGVYYLLLETENFRTARKMILIK